jgi:nucleoside-diphosphate-sugar epimerase
MIYVFGHKGNIGSSLVKHLGDRYDVVGVGRSDKMPVFTRHDIIINAAVHGWHLWERTDAWTTLETNFDLPLNIALHLNGAQMIQLGASFEFLNPDVPTFKLKRRACEYLRELATLTNKNIRIVYIYTSFGGTRPQWRFLDKLIHCAVTGEIMTITTPNATRDWVHMDRICQGIESLFNENGFRTHHFATGRPKSMLRAVGLVEGILGRKLDNIVVEYNDEGTQWTKAGEPFFEDTFIEDVKRELEEVRCGLEST